MKSAHSILLFCLLSLSVFSQPPGARYRWEHAAMYEPAVPPEIYKMRRQKLLAKLPDSAFALVFSNPLRTRQNDVTYEYRQNSTLLYLTGIPIPQTTVLLVPSGISIGTTSVRDSAVVFLPPRNRRSEVWTGARPGPEEIEEIYGIKAFPDSLFLPTIQKLLQEKSVLYIDNLPTPFLDDPIFLRRIFLRREIDDVLKERYPNIRLRSLRQFIAELRQIKDSAEIALLQKAIAITIAGHRNVMQNAAAGMYEYQLENQMECTFRELGAEAVGYPSIIASGPNSCILHYNTNRRKIAPGDLVLMDCGAEYHGYTADITRTFPINGRFSPEQRALYTAVLEAQDSALAVCKPGSSLAEVHRAAQSVIARHLRNLGIISESDQLRWYFPHYTSHFLGLDVHDLSSTQTLQPGMVLTIEPGVYIPEGSPCDPKWWNIGIRIEDDVLITADGAVVLSADLEKRIEDIERLMSNNRE